MRRRAAGVCPIGAEALGALAGQGTDHRVSHEVTLPLICPYEGSTAMPAYQRFSSLFLFLFLLSSIVPGALADDLNVSFADPAWDGKKIPDGQQCTKFGGKGGTPALQVDNIPAGTNAIIVEFNDRDYQPLSRNGGHGKIGFWILEGSSSALLPSVPGETNDLPEGSFVEKDNRATGAYARPGYLPPCSGGRGNRYFAEVKAVQKVEGKKKPKVLAKTRIQLGRY